MVMVIDEDQIKLMIPLKKRQKEEECCSRETIPKFKKKLKMTKISFSEAILIMITISIPMMIIKKRT